MRTNNLRLLAAASMLSMASGATASVRTKEEIEAEAAQAGAVKNGLLEMANDRQQTYAAAAAFDYHPNHPRRQFKPGPLRATDSEQSMQPADRAARRRAERAEAKLQAQLWKQRRGR